MPEALGKRKITAFTWAEHVNPGNVAMGVV